MVCLVAPYAFDLGSIYETFSGSDSAAGTSHPVVLPTRIVPGDRVILIVGAAADGGDVTFPAGWTELSDVVQTGATCAIAYRDCDGTEDGTTVTMTTTVSTRAAVAGIKIPAGGYTAGQAPEVGTAATANDANPNAPSISPSWGTNSDSLVLAVFGAGASPANTISAYPTSYSLYNVYIAASGGFDGYVGMAGRSLNTAAENPGTYTISTTDRWLAQTIAVRL